MCPCYYHCTKLILPEKFLLMPRSEKILNMLFSYSVIDQSISQRAVRASLEKQLDQRGPIASQGGSVPEFLKKPIATCDFLGGKMDLPRLLTLCPCGGVQVNVIGFKSPASTIP